MTRRKRLSLAALSLGIVGSMSIVAHAALTLAAPSDSHVSFQASGPAGMTIEGTTPDLTVTDDGTNLLVTVPLANLSTGIGLRDHHMREKYLEVPKYPVATLTIAKSALRFPAASGQATADVPGTLQLHGQTKPVTVHYDAKGDSANVTAHGTFHVNMNDFGITVPVYLGVTVKPDVEVSASFHVAGS
jgi:polyisoprenoid-binding protein YceI